MKQLQHTNDCLHSTRRTQGRKHCLRTCRGMRRLLHGPVPPVAGSVGGCRARGQQRLLGRACTTEAIKRLLRLAGRSLVALESLCAHETSAVPWSAAFGGTLARIFGLRYAERV